MATDTQSPARDAASSSTTTTTTTSWRGRGRGRGRGGRGRGGGRGGASAAATVAKAATATRGRGGLRRGRAKHFTDSRVQAAYERQRDLKATYQAVAHALKPALAELAERSVDDMMANQEAHKQSPEYRRVMDQLKQNLADKFAMYNRRLKHDMQLAKDLFEADQYIADKEFENGFNDLDEQFFESQENRLRILNALLDRGLPVDIQDDQYEFVVISDEHLDEDFSTYTCFKDGKLVPYPSRVEGTDMWQRARDAEAVVVSNVPSSAPSGRGRGRGRGGIKRRAADQPDGQPTPKKSARLMDDSSLLEPAHVAPAPAKGLLASAAVVEDREEGTPADEDSVPASPEPPNLFNGISSAAYNRAQGKLHSREKSPPLPKNIGEPDEYGLRVYNQRPGFREKSSSSRVLAPHVFHWNDWEIGFRDSVNDSTKGHTRAKRGKYLDQPDSNGMHFDHWCNGYDYSSTTPEDFDQELVRKHGVHPKYGIFLPTSTNEAETPDPYVMPGKPIVFVANPSGRIVHASRSFQATNNTRRAEEAPLRKRFSASMRRFCKMQDVGEEDVAVTEYVPTDDELKARSLGTAVRELKSRPVERAETTDAEEEKAATPAVPEDPEALRAAMSAISYAALMLEAQDASRAPAPTPKPAARYDAIRDIFDDVKPKAQPPVQDHTTGLGLSVLAELCNVKPRQLDEERSTTAYPPIARAAHESDVRSAAERYPNLTRMSIETGLTPTELPPDIPSGQHHPQSMYRSIGPHMGPGSERFAYGSSRDHSSAYTNPSAHDYKTHPPPSVHDLGAYPPHPGYPGPDPRDSQPPPSRGYESAYPRRMSSYVPDNGYSRPYWGQSQPPAGPPKSSSTQPYAPPPPPPPPHSSRMPFAQTASAEPLPPLRPPRGRNSLPGEAMMDSSHRPGEPGSANNYYSPGPHRPYHLYSGSEQQSSMQHPSSERMLPALQQGGSSGYMASPPPQPYPPTNPMLSPTFANPPLMSSQLAAQSPPDTPQGPPSSVRRHQSTPSGSSDAGSGKYRKLQPAPVPAHRTWSSKQELKTIPYDHKETGSAAALPQSGPTTIRGWNVNAHKKRGGSKADKAAEASPSQEREESR